MTSMIYSGYLIDEDISTLTGRWEIDSERFEEVFTFPAGGNWGSEQAQHAAKWLYLLAGVSYYKTRAPEELDLGEIPVTQQERRFLLEYYQDGLGEFVERLGLPSVTRAVRNLTTRGGVDWVPQNSEVSRPDAQVRPLVPFGGGLDSIVSVELLRPRAPEMSLFVVSRPGDEFPAIERPASATGLPIQRASRLLDEKVLRSTQLGYHNGHVPVTGIISAMAVLTAALQGHDAVVMSNEWSASAATMTTSDGRTVNHQYSKSLAFERGFAQVLRLAPSMPDYFSLLRARSELWIAKTFVTRCYRYLGEFCSCNRAFRINQAERSRGWCGECDKCAFIDLMLSPYVTPDELRWVFEGSREPLENDGLSANFERLLGMVPNAKPWECVGDFDESQTALSLAAARPDRVNNPLIKSLLDKIQPTMHEETLLMPLGPTLIPKRYD